MTIKFSIEPPVIEQKFSKDLLSTPIWGFNAEKLKKICDWLERHINDSNVAMCPNRVNKLTSKYKEFMDLYERAKIKERENEKEKACKTHMFGYRPRIANRDRQHLFGRLERKV